MRKGVSTLFFCGIHEEEAIYLRKQEKEFLEKVHIVPIQPSLLTMSSECFFELNCTNLCGADESYLISRSTETAC